jgi:hypothetical protein
MFERSRFSEIEYDLILLHHQSLLQLDLRILNPKIREASGINNRFTSAFLSRVIARAACRFALLKSACNWNTYAE